MENTKQLNSEKMRNTPIGKLLFSMSIPAILSMLVQALYNVVDTIFVSRSLGEDGIKALSLAFPLQILIIAFAVGIGVGVNAQIAKKLGEGKHEEASRFAKMGVFLAVSVGLVFMVLGFTIVKPFLNGFKAGEVVTSYGISYLTIVMALSLGSFVEITCSKILQATGNMKIPMISQLIGACINIILDPLLIFGVGIFPEMGVTGAAIATVVGQFVAMTFVLCVFIFRKHDVSISPKGIKFKKEYVLGICIIGFPTMVMNAVASITTTVMNVILAPIQEGVGVSILGIYFKMQSFVFMPVFGLTQGLMPILSYNYGSGDKKRFKHALRLALISAVSIMAAGLLLFQFGAPMLMKLFKASGEFLTAGTYALRIISISFIPAAFGIVLTTTMQSLGKGFTSLMLSLLRQVVLLLPLGALFAILFQLKGVWFCYPLSEIIVVLVFLPVAIKLIKKCFANLKSTLPLSDSEPITQPTISKVDENI